MRNAFVSRLTDIAKTDEKVILITADLGFGLFDDFRKNLPGQFLNVGVAEQNMIGVASGLALEGYIPFCYSIANFSFMRCLEQIRNDVCYHDLNVTIVSNGAGFSYGPLGMSHHATEDISLMRAIPNIDLLIPTNSQDTCDLTEYAYKSDKPSYLRLDKSMVTLRDSNSRSEDWEVINNGTDVCIISSGGITEEALQASQILKSSLSIEPKVICVKKIRKSLDLNVSEIFRGVRFIVTLEENVKSGGVGSYILEKLSDNGLKIETVRLGIEDKYESIVGDQQYLREINGLTANNVVRVIVEKLGLEV